MSKRGDCFEVPGIGVEKIFVRREERRYYFMGTHLQGERRLKIRLEMILGGMNGQKLRRVGNGNIFRTNVTRGE